MFYGGNISVNNPWSVLMIESQFELIPFSMAEIMARLGKSDFHNSIKYLKKNNNENGSNNDEFGFLGHN